MHPDLVALSNVWQPDAASDRLRSEHESLTTAVARASEALKQAEAAKAAAAQALDALQKEERAVARELDGYVQKRDTTRKMIDGGTAPDYAAAERQLAQCSAKVDELETSALELMEKLDAARAEVKATTAATAKAGEVLAAARAALGARDASLRAELAEAQKRREAAFAELPHDLRTPYLEQRRRKRPALVNVVEGICSHCHMRIPPQKLNETVLHRAVHACPGCGGYLLP
ncbi:MAG: zinc ribbon domain-containing protein [Myxococcota bacterium]